MMAQIVITPIVRRNVAETIVMNRLDKLKSM